MKFNPNGFVVQQDGWIPKWREYAKDFNYHGISAFSDYPLYDYRLEPECKAMMDEVWWVCKDGNFIERSIISDSDLLRRYVALCGRYDIPLRLLFLESEIEDFLWSDPLPEMKFIGYEYCECPFDCQVVSDLSWYEPFDKHRAKLNEYGLFKTLEDALAFKADYDQAFQSGAIGDGDMETYLFRVSEVDVNQIFR